MEKEKNCRCWSYFRCAISISDVPTPSYKCRFDLRCADSLLNVLFRSYKGRFTLKCTDSPRRVLMLYLNTDSLVYLISSILLPLRVLFDRCRTSTPVLPAKFSKLAVESKQAQQPHLSRFPPPDNTATRRLRVLSISHDPSALRRGANPRRPMMAVPAVLRRHHLEDSGLLGRRQALWEMGLIFVMSGVLL